MTRSAVHHQGVILLLSIFLKQPVVLISTSLKT